MQLSYLMRSSVDTKTAQTPCSSAIPSQTPNAAAAGRAGGSPPRTQSSALAELMELQNASEEEECARVAVAPPHHFSAIFLALTGNVVSHLI